MERRRVACKECRAQKVRCDAEPPETCSRCRRLGLVCAVSASPHVRQTKAQLQKELERLKAGSGGVPSLSSSASPGVGPSSSGVAGSVGGRVEPLAPPPPLASPSERRPSLHGGGMGARARRPASAASSAALQGAGGSSSVMAYSSISPSAGTDYTTPASEAERCASRTLDDQEIEGRKIRDCFKLFFRDYLPILPILESPTTPDECFETSQFLFWTIVFVGSRRYARDPTLLNRLTPRINSMALRALESRANPIQTIAGLLFLCVWPVPLNTMYKDVSNVLSGAAIHLAMQIGLHVIGSGQDFARTRLNSDHEQKVYRAQLWVHCLMISHNTSLREGLPPMMITPALIIGPDDDELLSEFPEELRTRRKIHNILVSATVAVVKSLQDATLSTTPNPLSPFISLFDAQFLDVAGQCRSALSALYAWCGRLHLLAYYFFERPDSPNRVGMMRLYAAACGFIDAMAAEDHHHHDSHKSPASPPPPHPTTTTPSHHHHHLIETCPAFLDRSVPLAAFAILKIMRSPALAQHVDLEQGERAYFAAILLSRRGSLQNDDLSARAVSILSQLWASRRIFRRADGTTQSLGTRIRSRLSMSVVFDCFWWWREEFGGQTSPYAQEPSQTTPKRGTYVTSPAVVEDGVEANGDPYPLPEPDPGLLLFPADPFPDFDWAANLDFSDFNWTNTAFSN